MHARPHRGVGDPDHGAVAVVVEDDGGELLAHAVLEHPRLDVVHDRPLHPRGARARLAHHLGQLRERLAVAATGHQVEHVAVGQPPQRRGRVGVAGGDAGVLGALRRRALEEGVAGVPHRVPCLLDQRRLVRQRRIERGHELGERPALGPVHSQAGGSGPQLLHPVGIGAAHRAQQPQPARHHDAGRRHPGQQRDLGVPVLVRRAVLELEPVAAVLGRIGHHRLGGGVQRDRSPLPGQRQAQRADLLQQRHLGLAVGQPLVAAHDARGRPAPPSGGRARRARSRTPAPAAPGRAAGWRRPRRWPAGRARSARPGSRRSGRAARPPARRRRPQAPRPPRRRSRSAPCSRRRSARAASPGRGPCCRAGRWSGTACRAGRAGPRAARPSRPPARPRPAPGRGTRAAA